MTKKRKPKQRKPRSLWVWVEPTVGIWHYENRPDCVAKKPIARYLKPSASGRYVEFREVLTKKQKDKRNGR